MQKYSYGLAPGLMLACSTMLLLVTLTSSLVLTLCEEPMGADEPASNNPRNSKHEKFVARLSQVSAGIIDTGHPQM